MGGWVIDRWVAGWMGGWVGGWMDGALTHAYLHVSIQHKTSLKCRDDCVKKQRNKYSKTLQGMSACNNNYMQ